VEIVPLYGVMYSDTVTQSHSDNNPETTRKQPGNNPETTWKQPGNNLDNNLETTWKQPGQQPGQQPGKQPGKQHIKIHHLYIIFFGRFFIEGSLMGHAWTLFV